MTEKLTLNIGCGRCKEPLIEGKEIRVDILDMPEVDVIWDLNKFPYPFEDNKFDKIIARDILEHLDDIFGVMEQLHRILKVGGTIYIHTTYWKTEDSFTDPQHKHFFTLRSFDYFDKDTQLGRDYGFYSRVNFKILEKYLDGNGYTNFVLKKI